MTTTAPEAPVLTATGYVIAYMAHSGIAHLAEPSDFNPGLFGTTRPLCRGSLMQGAVSLASVPSCYTRCTRCTEAATR